MWTVIPMLGRKDSSILVEWEGQRIPLANERDAIEYAKGWIARVDAAGESAVIQKLDVCLTDDTGKTLRRAHECEFYSWQRKLWMAL